MDYKGLFIIKRNSFYHKRWKWKIQPREIQSKDYILKFRFVNQIIELLWTFYSLCKCKKNKFFKSRYNY